MRLIALPAVLLLIAAGRQDEAVSLKYKYAKGDREVTRTEVEMTMDVSVTAEGTTFNQTQTGPINFNLQLDCTSTGASGFTFDLAFTDMEMKQTMDVNGTKMTVAFKGKHVRVENEEGAAVIDTEQDINSEAAQEILKEMEGFHKKWQITVDDRGLPKGDFAKLKKLLGSAANEGLYPLVLPDKKVKVGDEWVHTAKLKELGKLKLAKPIDVPTTFRLEKIEDGKIAVITSKIDHTVKDAECEGEMEGVPGTSKITINQLKSVAKTESRFSIESGRLLSSRLESNVTGDMKIQAEQSETPFDSTLKITIAGKVAPKK